jgi:hypothetical protein
MTGRQRSKVVEAHADLILADEPSVEAYAAYFETQMHRGKVQAVLYQLPMVRPRLERPDRASRYWPSARPSRAW